MNEDLTVLGLRKLARIAGVPPHLIEDPWLIEKCRMSGHDFYRKGHDSEGWYPYKRGDYGCVESRSCGKCGLCETRPCGGGKVEISFVDIRRRVHSEHTSGDLTVDYFTDDKGEEWYTKKYPNGSEETFRAGGMF